MGNDDSVPVYCDVAETSVRGTHRLHNTHEGEDTASSIGGDIMRES